MARLVAESKTGTVRGDSAPARGEPRWYLAAEIVFLVLLFAAAFLCRLWPIWKVHFWDETVYLQNAEVICCGKQNYSELSSRPPLLSLLIAGVFLLWHHVYAASLLVAGLNALGPVFAYWAGKMLAGRATGGMAGLLLAGSPFFNTSQTGNSLLTDSPALTLTLLALCLLLKAIATNSKIIPALAGIVTGLSGLMRFPSLITVFVFPLFLLRARQRLWTAILFGIGLTVSFGPYLAWSQLKFGSFLYTLRLAQVQVGGSVEPRGYYLEHFSEIFPWLSLAGAMLWMVAWLLDARTYWRLRGEKEAVPPQGGEAKARLLSDAVLWWWAAIVLLYFTSIPHKELRYLIPLAAPWFLLAGRGLGLLLRGERWPARVIGGGILALAMAYTFAPTLQRFRGPLVQPWVSEEKQVADYLNQIATPPAVLYTNFNAPVFGYYTQLPVRVLLEQDVNFYSAFPKNMPKDGYVILYKEVQKDPRPVWADLNAHFRRLQEFPSLIVYEYRSTEFSQPPNTP